MKTMQNLLRDDARHRELATLPVAPGDDDGIDYWRQFRTIWKGRWWVLSVTLAVVVAAWVLMTISKPMYETQATVFLTPAAFTTNLIKAGRLPADSYRQLAESALVMDKVNLELERGSGKPPQGLLFTAEVSGVVDPKDPYASLLALKVRAPSPTDAKVAADKWAQIFVSEMATLSSPSKSSSMDFVLSEYPTAAAKLSEAQQASERVETRHAQNLARLRADTHIDLMTALSTGYAQTISELEQHLSRLKGDLAGSQTLSAEYDQELRQVPERMSISKSVTDDARLLAGAGNAGVKLQSGEANTVYSDLQLKLATERARAKALASEIAAIDHEITATHAKAEATDGAIAEAQRRVYELRRAQTDESASYDRAVVAAQKPYETLSEKVGEARIAKADESRDVRLAALAVQPKNPVPRHVLRNVLIIGLLALVASMVMVWLAVQVARSYSSDRMRAASQAGPETV